MTDGRRRVGIIGTGWVGSSVAISVLHSGAADELLLCDQRGEVAEGEAMDLAQGAPFYPTASVRTATVEETADADVIVISAGRGGRPEETRLDLLRENAAIVRDLGRRLQGARGTIVMVTNPVDVLTQVMTEASGLDPTRVIGTGTMLDTARLRQAVGRELTLDPHSIHGLVVGEHGDSEVVLWSGVRIGGVPLRHWPGWSTENEGRLATQIRTAAYEIIRRKGATNHAIGLVTADLLRCMLRGEQRVLTVSRMQDGAAGLEGVALSMPTLVGAHGGSQILEPLLDEDERAALHRSADVLRSAYRELTPA